MRRLLLIAGGVIGIALLIVIAVVGYAYFNLNSIIAANRARLLARASAAIGRPLEAGEIKASLGRGTAIEVSGVKLADEASFSQLPFIQADDVLLKVQLLPLLHKEIKVTELVLKQPQIRIIRDASGAMNLSSIAKKGSRQPGGLGGGIETLPSGEGGGAATVSNLTIETLTIEDGRIFYLDRQAGGTSVNINAVNLSITHFSPTNPFDVTLDLAAFGTTKNLTVSGTAGPIMKDGAVDTGAIPINLDATVGPLTLAQLRAIPALAGALPRALIISDEVNLQAKIAGTVDAISFDLASDLSGNRVAYAPSFDKPAGTALKFAASGGRTAERVFVQQANLTLADLRAKLSNIAFSAGGLSARIDSNRFDLRPIAQLITPAQRYNPTGSAEIHSGLHFAHSKPDLNGTVTLANVNLAMPEGNAPPVSDFNGTIRLAGTAANIGPLTFKLGSGNARLQVSADSLQPLHAIYQLSVDKIAIAELVPSRKDQGDENLLQVAATGTVGNAGGAFGGSTKLGAASGVLANVPFTQLSLDAAFAHDRISVNSLKFGAFDGSIAAAGVATLGDPPSFDFKVDTQTVSLQKALDSQHAKAADTIRGSLTANLQIAGQGKGMDQIKPTLRGSGRARMENGKLIGVNVVAQALKKVDNVPGIGALVPAAVVANHPELFQSPDTDIQAASLTFTILGPRISSQDIVARSTDYSIFSDGWFDLDKNIDMAAKIRMSRPFSHELVAARRNISYLTNSDSEVEIPLRISGQLPHPAVVPDVGVIAQRALTHEAQRQVGNVIEKNGVGRLLKKNGLGGLLGGLTGDNSNGNNDAGGAGASAGSPEPTPPANGSNDSGPLPGGLINPLKGLFH